MSYRKVVAEEMANFLSALSHPDRVRIALELQDGEQEVSVLREALGISPSRLSQHLGLLKSHHIVRERKEGRRVFYHLEQVGLGRWLLEGMTFIQQESQRLGEVVAALHQVTALKEG
ncbi:MAG: winged helix-turn-helix transcriptional regulator [Candidatus Eremiobacteraeota bacterium]|nr:winged helix-turn-helix transcriptional regulator [Candidatus Eremiobacteraeota bacterium]MCW5869709.1 winged helix-turn-helix transcriptional regulator [Candidatus Eremiobacteraeota bacterium]